jgi:hypothetical protein
MSCRGRSQEAPGLHLERARDRAGGSRTAWRRLLAGGVPGPGVVVGIFIEVIYTFTALRNSRKWRKTDGFAHVLAYKSPKTPFFALKYFTTYTHETFFVEYTNFEAHYLSRFGVISVRSFGSHICPQPHGLGLKDLLRIKVFSEYALN